MRSSSFKFEKAPAFLLAVFLFLLAVYSKQFAYLNLRVAGQPIFVSELTLAFVLLLRLPAWKRVLGLPKDFLFFVACFLGWGFFRAILSFPEKQPDVSIFELLKQTCLFYQAVWVFLPFLFSLEECRKFFSVTLAGVGVAQFLGWSGFLLMGVYGNQYSRLIGFPVGDEVLLPLYPLAFLVWSRPWPEVMSVGFGQLWLTQFILYMKRTWVFSVFAFGFSLVLWLAGPQRKRVMKRALVSFGLGILLAALGLFYVRGREQPIFYHGDEVKSARQRADMWLPEKILLKLLDSVFPYSDPLQTNVSISRIVFKGDLATTEQGVPSLMAFRMHLWRQAWAGFVERPIVGQGFGTHIAKTQLNGLPAVVDGRWISGAHNSFLTILNRMGLLGILFFTGIWVAAGRQLYCRRLTIFSWVIIAAVLNMNFFSLFNVCMENPQGGIWYWLFLGMLLRAVMPNQEHSDNAG